MGALVAGAGGVGVAGVVGAAGVALPLPELEPLSAGGLHPSNKAAAESIRIVALIFMIVCLGSNDYLVYVFGFVDSSPDQSRRSFCADKGSVADPDLSVADSVPRQNQGNQANFC